MLYYYKANPELWGQYEYPSSALQNSLRERVNELTPVGFITYLLHRLVNGRAFKKKYEVHSKRAVTEVLKRLEKDFHWANEKGWLIEIRLCSHIGPAFGVSLLLCMKQMNTDKQGWTMLEQVIIKRSNGKYAIWCYGED